MELEPGDLEAAAEFCRLVQTADLFEYLGISPESPPEAAREALAKKRKHMQGMQGNPKFKDSATFLIKNFRRLERVIEDPPAHVEASRRAREDERIPMLELALQGILADGVVTREEEAFLRRAALELGISEDRYEEVLGARLREAEVDLSFEMPAPKPEPPTEPALPIAGDPDTSPEAETTARLRGAEGHGWWDAAFTRLLLECIPGGPGDAVDMYCRTALSATTLLPERPQLAWVGVDPNAERLDAARRALASLPPRIRERASLTRGTPDHLPLEENSVDYALAIRALANLSDTRPVLDEAWRVLRPGGRIIVAEPDGLAEEFYFGGHLTGYNAAFHRLCAAADDCLGGRLHALGRPGLAIGPTLPARMEAAGFVLGSVRVHASHNLGPGPYGRLSRRLRRYPTAIAQQAGLGGSKLLADVLHEVDRLDGAIPTDSVAMSGHLLPLFLVVGEKD